MHRGEDERGAAKRLQELGGAPAERLDVPELRYDFAERAGALEDERRALVRETGDVHENGGGDQDGVVDGVRVHLDHAEQAPVGADLVRGRLERAAHVRQRNGLDRLGEAVERARHPRALLRIRQDLHLPDVLHVGADSRRERWVHARQIEAAGIGVQHRLAFRPHEDRPGPSVGRIDAPGRRDCGSGEQERPACGPSVQRL